MCDLTVKERIKDTIKIYYDLKNNKDFYIDCFCDCMDLESCEAEELYWSELKNVGKSLIKDINAYTKLEDMYNSEV